MKLLVSVRSVDEALIAAAGGADFIDAKEPSAGALGALPLPTVRAIVAALPGRTVSATIGDVAGASIDAVRARVQATAACGVSLVKVGIAPDASGALLDALAECGAPIVPVFIADYGLDATLVARACTLPFAAVMLDTDDKLGGSLFDKLAEPELQRFVSLARAAGKPYGLAGALRLEHLPQLARLAPDFAGFRSAVCIGTRSAALDATRLAALREGLRSTSVCSTAVLH